MLDWIHWFVDFWYFFHFSAFWGDLLYLVFDDFILPHFHTLHLNDFILSKLNGFLGNNAFELWSSAKSSIESSSKREARCSATCWLCFGWLYDSRSGKEISKRYNCRVLTYFTPFPRKYTQNLINESQTRRLEFFSLFLLLINSASAFMSNICLNLPTKSTLKNVYMKIWINWPKSRSETPWPNRWNAGLVEFLLKFSVFVLSLLSSIRYKKAQPFK